MASNKTDKKMTDFRKWIDSEIIKHNRNRKNVEIKSKPSMSFVVDKKTDKLAAKKSKLKFYYVEQNFYKQVKSIVNSY